MQNIVVGAKSLFCSPLYGLVAMVIGAINVAYASAEMQEALGYGNWLKDEVGLSGTAYNAGYIVSNFAAVAINMVGVKQCFKEGTLVACLDEDGNETQLPIEKIAVGTLVLAYDETTGEKAYKPVVQLFHNETKQWCTVCVEVDGKEEHIVSTPGHKYYLPFNTENRELGLKQEHESYYELSEKWVSAYKLKVGDKVLISDGKYGIIKSVKIENLSTLENTYNLEVADFHTYYVGTNPVCVHNNGCQRGSNNPKTREAAAKGREKHKNYNYGEGVSKEQVIPGAGRADGIDYDNRIVYELKPNNPRAIAKGEKQLKRYLDALGDDWIGELITYDS